MTTLREAAKLALEYISWQAFGECRIGEGPIPEAKDVVRALRKALAEPEQPERAQMTQAMAEELAHRRCRRYIMIDTEAPYQFDGHTLMDFVADIEKVAMATIKESLIVESNQPRMPLTIDQIEVCMKRAYAAAAGSRNLEICFAREIESEHGTMPQAFGAMQE